MRVRGLLVFCQRDGQGSSLAPDAPQVRGAERPSNAKRELLASLASEIMMSSRREERLQMHARIRRDKYARWRRRKRLSRNCRASSRTGRIVEREAMRANERSAPARATKGQRVAGQLHCVAASRLIGTSNQRPPSPPTERKSNDIETGGVGEGEQIEFEICARQVGRRRARLRSAHFL